MTAQDSRTRETECDLLVVGSGAGGLSAATTAAWHGLRVVVVEKDRVCGGATAWSGGWAWVPLNPLSQADGIVEDLDGPRTYLKHVLGEHYDAARVDALLDAGRHMVSFFEQNTALQFVSGTWIADIQGHVPGAGTGGRSVGPKPVNGRALGGHLLDKLRPQLYETSFLGLGIMAGPDLQAFLHATRGDDPGQARDRTGGGRFSGRRRPPPRAVSTHADRPGTLDAGSGLVLRRRDQPGAVGRRPAGDRSGLAGGVVPGFPGAISEWTSGPVPAHRRPRQARADRGAG
jgi:FAD binding domain